MGQLIMIKMETTLDNYYNYILLDTRHPGEWVLLDNTIVNFKPFYVGKGRGNRLYTHFRWKVKKDKNLYKKNIINKIFEETNTEPKFIKLNENCSSEYTLSQEILLISDIIEKYGNILTNLTPGGENPPVKFGVDNNKARKVYKYSMSGKFLKEYDVISEAAVQNNIKSISHICGCCSGERKSCGGFIWKYEYFENGITINSSKYDRLSFGKIIAYNEIETLEFNSLKEAYSFLGTTNKGHINKVITGKSKSYKGYIWKIEENELL